MLGPGTLSGCILAAAAAATALWLIRPDHHGVLATAAIYAGDKPALVRFMRDMGYPKHGEWCGEFAASIVATAGGSPPSGASLASNWRRYGTADAMPRLGDVAVADRGVPTGETGSHVGFVTGVHPSDGTFTLESGNASSIYTTRKISCFSFHRPPDTVLSALIGNGIPAAAALARQSATDPADADDCSPDSVDTDRLDGTRSAGGRRQVQARARAATASRPYRSCAAAPETGRQCPRRTARAAACFI